jgi:hypothetical protein
MTMSVTLIVLIACVAITWMLGKTKVVGGLTVAGFVLGSLATACLFLLLG